MTIKDENFAIEFQARTDADCCRRLAWRACRVFMLHSPRRAIQPRRQRRMDRQLHTACALSTLLPRRDVLAWWAPHSAMLVALLLPVPVRSVIWMVALMWMGSACILNARQCGRTHCRYTGPYYLAMIIPVLVLVSSGVSANVYGWIVLGVVIFLGSKIIWWATGRAWGKFS